MKKKVTIVLIISLIVLGVLSGTFFYFKERQDKLEKSIKEERILVEKIKNSYSKYVMINDAYLYKKSGGEYSKIMKISSSKEFTLKDTKIDKNTKYFLIDELGYYVRYQDVSKIDELAVKDLRYKNYLPFNYNIVTNDKVTLYQDDKAIYELYYSLDTPVIELDEAGYIIEFNDEEYLVKKEDVLSTHEANNTTLTESVSVPVTCYHFIYLNGDNTCNESICHSEN